MQEWSKIRDLRLAVIVFGCVMLCFIWGGLFYKVQGEQQELDKAADDTGNYARAFVENTGRNISGMD